MAALGAGKTTLGIEILTHINTPTLILAPTITIRNQWEGRIISDFTDSNLPEKFISFTIKNSAVITISTYQALLATFCNFDEIEKDRKFLLKAKKNSYSSAFKKKTRQVNRWC